MFRMKNVSFKKETIFKSTENRSKLSSGTSNAICNCWSPIFHLRKYKNVTNLGKLFFHSVSKLNLVALKASACCSTVSRTIFQKHSETAKLRFLVVIVAELTTPPLATKNPVRNIDSTAVHFFVEWQGQLFRQLTLASCRWVTRGRRFRIYLDIFGRKKSGLFHTDAWPQIPGLYRCLIRPEFL